MFALIATEQLDAVGQVMVKQLKNRYNDVAANRKFVIGIDRSKMKLFDVDESQQQLIQGNHSADVEDENTDNGFDSPNKGGGGYGYKKGKKPSMGDWS
jgi:hypothetical protein